MKITQKVAERANKSLPKEMQVNPRMVRVVLEEYFKTGPHCVICGKPIRGAAVYDPYYSKSGFMHGPKSKCFHWNIQQVIEGLRSNNNPL